MKELLIQTAERTGLADAQKLAEYLNNDVQDQRLDEALLACPFFTEDIILKLFAEALGWPYLNEVPEGAVPPEFIESVPATYAQHHYLIGVKTEALSSQSAPH